MFNNKTGKTTLVASVAALVLALALVVSQAANGQAAAAAERALLWASAKSSQKRAKQ